MAAGDAAAQDGRVSGVFMLAINPAAFRPAGEFGAVVDRVLQNVKSVPPASGFSEVLIPGEPEARSREQRLREGIPVPDDTWRALQDAAATLGVPVPAPE
ncbi:MAG: hypothetical protein C4289_05195 [Chloroflexota bacterium]